jgi:hypothetical protein
MNAVDVWRRQYKDDAGKWDVISSTISTAKANRGNVTARLVFGPLSSQVV